MPDEDEKIRENRLRRAAKRQGLRLEKSRVRDPRALTYGGYHLIDARTNVIVAFGQLIGFEANLDDIERYLTSDERLTIRHRKVSS
jgi:hypothetical protein